MTRRAKWPELALGLALAVTAACSGGSSDDDEESDSFRVEEDKRKSAKTYNITLVQFQSLVPLQWVQDDEKRLYTEKRAVEFKGSCSSGLHSVQGYVDAEKTGPVNLCSGGYFTFSNSFNKDGEFVFEMKPLLEDGSAAGTSIVKTVVVDTTAPEQPVIVTNNGADIYQDFATFDLDGTVEKGVNKVTVEGGETGKVTLSEKKQAFDFLITLEGDAESRKLKFYAWDRLGRKSTPKELTLYYKITRRLAAFGTTWAVSVAPSKHKGKTKQLAVGTGAPAIVSGTSRSGVYGKYELKSGITGASGEIYK